MYYLDQSHGWTRKRPRDYKDFSNIEQSYKRACSDTFLQSPNRGAVDSVQVPYPVCSPHPSSAQSGASQSAISVSFSPLAISRDGFSPQEISLDHGSSVWTDTSISIASTQDYLVSKPDYLIHDDLEYGSAGHDAHMVCYGVVSSSSCVNARHLFTYTFTALRYQG